MCGDDGGVGPERSRQGVENGPPGRKGTVMAAVVTAEPA
jgi:hypothetical protein